MHHDSPYRHIPRGPNARRDSTPSASSAAGVAWNLGDLYSGPGDPALVKDQAATLEAARAFAQEFRGAVAGLDAEALTGALRRLEALHTRAYGPVIFAYLRFAAETAGTGPSGSHNGAALQAAKEHHTAFSEELLFFDLEWQHLPESQAQALLSHPGLSPWRHHLSKVRRMAPYTLSEPEERILAVKENTGRGAFERLFDESTSSLRCLLAGPDQPAAEVSLEEALSLLHHPDRTRRAAAADAITATLRGQERLLGYVMNTIVRDHADEDRLRGRNHPMLARNLANEIEQAGVDALLDACDSGMALVGRYYKLKRRLLGLDRLYDYDRYAPLGTDLPGCSWSEAREIVLSSYAAFSPALAQIVSRFLNEGWIDAEPRPSKQGGAFSASTLPQVHPYILLNYQGTMRDVMTLAHELGHGVHQYLSAPQGLFQMHTPLTTAETASVFGEMLTFRTLMARTTQPRERLALLCGKLEDIFATVFRQAVMTRFEQSVHTARREQGELDPATLGDLWMRANQPMFGDALELRPDYAHWWAYISHFVHSPFYCYAYSFGELLVLALYRQYEVQGPDFVPRYLQMLAAGGSDSPANLVRTLGLDLNDPQFWNQGLTLLEDLVRQAEDLAREAGLESEKA